MGYAGFLASPILDLPVVSPFAVPLVVEPESVLQDLWRTIQDSTLKSSSVCCCIRAVYLRVVVAAALSEEDGPAVGTGNLLSGSCLRGDSAGGMMSWARRSSMTADVRDLLAAFDALPPAEQQQMAAEILRRTAGAGDLTEAALDELAAELFRADDTEEAAGADG
jgi:hypothetical protein